MAAADYALVADAIQYLELNQTEQPSLDELADHLHISPFHLQRVFKRWAGISPKRFLQYLTVEHAKALLAASHSVLDATYAAGLSSPSRLHDLFVTVEAMTPGEFKEGGQSLTIRYGIQPSPFGDCLLAMTDRGVCGLSFVNGDGIPAEVAQLRQSWPNARLVEDAAGTAGVAQRIFAAPDLHMTQQPEPLRLLLTGTNFQIRVWEALLRIPSGAVTTYADVAAAIGQPSAARAVGSAVGANHIAYLIPCHRVIRKNGLVRDYRWGATRKKAMLGWESAHAGAAD
ncbi:MAG: methylated-DNA--[protein]-cysteine S-methyltransferase [Anaerolineales bacterium]|nr:methylated-DNA--[protein]-cysteine S-methyltransferase [Anaerolineales bacterium]